MDGGTALLGAFIEIGEAGPNAGSAFVFEENGGNWAEAELDPGDESRRDGFGYSLSVDHGTVAIGAPFDDTPDAAEGGSVYVFTHVDGLWTSQAKLREVVPSWNSTIWFGGGVAVQNDTLLVGAPRYHTDNGAVYVYTRTGSTWTRQQLILPLAEAEVSFGSSLALEEDTAVVGVSRAGTGSFLDHGAAYVYVRSAGLWSLQTTLRAADGVESDGFGASVDISGSAIIVGAPNKDGIGAAYIFTGGGPNWLEQAKLVAPGPTLGFGRAVSILADRALIGAPYQSVDGAAYVFLQNGGTWAHEATLLPNSSRYASFGRSVDLQGDLAAIGADYATSSISEMGAAALYQRAGASWQLQGDDSITSSQPDKQEYFGGSVVLDGDLLYVAAYGHGSLHNGGADQGRVYALQIGFQPLPEISVEAPGGATILSGGPSVPLPGAYYPAGETSTSLFTIRNIGDGPLSLNSLGFTASQTRFTLGALGTNLLQPGENTKFEVEFAPNSTNQVTATITLSSNDGNEAAFSIPIRGTGTAGAAPWRQYYFHTTANTGDAADLADPDHDGQTNLIERGLGSSPTNFQSRSLPEVSFVTMGGSTYQQMRFTPQPGNSDLTYRVYVSGDLVTWRTGLPYVNTTNFGITAGRDTTAVSSATSRYMKLEIVASP